MFIPSFVMKPVKNIMFLLHWCRSVYEAQFLQARGSVVMMGSHLVPRLRSAGAWLGFDDSAVQVRGVMFNG
jgi:hypothetical protein